MRGPVRRRGDTRDMSATRDFSRWAREIAEDPHGFILRQGWARLDFSEEAELTQLRRLC